MNAAGAQPFLGNWVMTLDTDFGVMDLDLQIEDMMGKVGARIGSPDLGGMQEITNISRAEETLVMSYDLDMEGQLIDVRVTLVPDGANLNATVEAAAGQVVMSTTATPAT